MQRVLLTASLFMLGLFIRQHHTPSSESYSSYRLQSPLLGTSTFPSSESYSSYRLQSPLLGTSIPETVGKPFLASVQLSTEKHHCSALRFEQLKQVI